MQIGLNQFPRTTLPERRQRVQTLIFCGLPSTTTCTVWIFGAQLRFVLRLEWLTKLPDMTPFLQTSQNLPIQSTSLLKLEHCNIITGLQTLQEFFSLYFMPKNEFWRRASYKIIAAAFERFNDLCPSPIGIRIASFS